ncbi:hypothetical protein Tco_1461482, partial [Tanacetum coccineum]
MISWQCKKRTVVATSTTEAKYVAATSCCGQVLWIQNQLLDYGYNFLNTAINIDNNSISKEVGTPRYLSLVVPLTKVGDEAVHKELGDRMERATTIGIGDVDAQTRFEITSKQSNDPPLSRGYTLGSGEDNMQLLELMEFFVLKLMLLSIQFLLLVYFNAAKLMLIMLGSVNVVRHILMLPVQVPAAEVNGVRQLQDLVDKKRVIITESRIRSDLHLDDAE